MQSAQQARRKASVQKSIAAFPPKRADGYYATPEWRSLRLAVLTRDKFRCAGCNGRANIADHIVSRRNGGSDDMGNLRSFCRACDNAVKERSDGSRRGRGVLPVRTGEDGWPVR